MLNRRSFLTLGLGAAVASALPQLMPVPLDSIFVPPPIIPPTYSGNMLLTPEVITREALRVLRQNLRFAQAFESSDKVAQRFLAVQQKGVDMKLSASDFRLPIEEFSDRHIKPGMHLLGHNIDRDWHDAVMTFESHSGRFVNAGEDFVIWRFDAKRLLA